MRDWVGGEKEVRGLPRSVLESKFWDDTRVG